MPRSVDGGASENCAIFSIQLLSFEEFAPGLSRKEIFKIAGKYSNFFKHARTDPEGVLDDFHEGDIDAVLYNAVHDLAEIEDHVLPAECQAYQVWYLMAHPETKVLEITDEYEEWAKELLGGLANLARNEQKARGLTLLKEALNAPEVMAHPKTDRSTLAFYPAGS